MKIVLDNNVVLDALLSREPFKAESERVMTACVESNVGCLTADSLTNIFYFIRKAVGSAMAKNALKVLTDNFEIISVTKKDCMYALSMDVADFEDALVAACAEHAGADYIITRDEKLLRDKTSVPTITPREFFAK